MAKPASIPILAAIPPLPVIVACALLGATDARAVTCSVNASECDPYVVTIDQVGPNVVATGSGEFDLDGLTSLSGSLPVPTPPGGTSGHYPQYPGIFPPLFATGLGGLGLLGWRRKRKARAGDDPKFGEGSRVK
jgi:hypothetical protein